LGGVIICSKRKTNSLPFFQPLKEKEKPFFRLGRDKPLFALFTTLFTRGTLNLYRAQEKKDIFFILFTFLPLFCLFSFFSLFLYLFFFALGSIQVWW